MWVTYNEQDLPSCTFGGGGFQQRKRDSSRIVEYSALGRAFGRTEVDTDMRGKEEIVHHGRLRCRIKDGTEWGGTAGMDRKANNESSGRAENAKEKMEVEKEVN